MNYIIILFSANRRNHNDDANTSSESWNLKKSPMKVLLIAGIISIIGISVGVYFAVKQNNVNSEKSKDILFGNGYDDDTCETLHYNFCYIKIYIL